MNTLTWVLVGVAVYWFVLAALKARGVFPDYVGVYGPLVTVHTKRGRRLIDRIAAPKRFWRAWGNFGLGVALVVMVGSVTFLALVAVATVQNPPEPSVVNQPQSALVIPGVNPFLPLSVAPEILFGLAVALVVHEGGHGVLCRVENIDIESLGLLLLTVVPAGAFVEPNEESQRTASRGGRARMFAAGVTNNFALTVLAFALLFGPVVGSLTVVPGATIAGSLPGSPAATAGIGGGTVITGVDDRAVESNADLQAALSRADERTVTVHRRSEAPVEVRRSLLVTGVVRPNPLGLSRNQTVVAVNGTPVHTTSGLDAALRNRTVAAFRTADGATTTGPAGAYVTVQADGPFAASGGPNGTMVVTAIDGHRVASRDDLGPVLEQYAPGEAVTVTGYVDGRVRRYDVTLGSRSGTEGAYLGVFTTPGVSGVTVSDFGVEPYPAGRYLSVLGGTCEGCPPVSLSFVQRTFVALQLPLVSVAGNPALPYNFPGFSGDVLQFYEATGPLAALGQWVFLLANLLFWTGWINVNLGFFNCIPTFMLDGGHIFRAAAESVVARLPVSDGRRVVSAATVSVQLVMLGSLLLLLFGAQLLN
ncbi:MAG: site-2 protease family protein [Halobacteriaceae archaeon]